MTTGANVLFSAAKHNRVREVKSLIERGADVNATLTHSSVFAVCVYSNVMNMCDVVHWLGKMSLRLSITSSLCILYICVRMYTCV